MDAQRNVDALIEAAKTVFAAFGVDAPVREIADQAGVGVGTLYRHFPERSDLVKAVLEREIDACADAGPALSAEHAPGEALVLWLWKYTELLGAKRGLATSLHSSESALEALRPYFFERMSPTSRRYSTRPQRTATCATMSAPTTSFPPSRSSACLRLARAQRAAGAWSRYSSTGCAAAEPSHWRRTSASIEARLEVVAVVAVDPMTADGRRVKAQ